MSILIGLMALAIAATSAAIGFGGWHTARCKLVLDLFNQRMEIYRKLCDHMGIVLRDGTADTQTIIAFSRLRHEAVFLFGEDVNTFLQHTAKTLVDFSFSGTMINANKGDVHGHIDSNGREIMKLAKFHEKLAALVGEYCRMDQKLPPTMLELSADIVKRAWSRLRASWAPATVVK